jgi:hypothetical protein
MTEPWTDEDRDIITAASLINDRWAPLSAVAQMIEFDMNRDAWLMHVFAQTVAPRQLTVPSMRERHDSLAYIGVNDR